MSLLPDEQLFEQLQNGDTAALDELYRKHARALYVFCSHAMPTSSSREPEDVVQDVFERVVRSAHTFDPQKASFRTWLFRIARNRCIDLSRRERILRFVPIVKGPAQNDQITEGIAEDTLVDERENVEGAVHRFATIAAVRDCINELDNSDEKQAFVLYYLGDKVYREIGDVLGKSTSMARNRVKSAHDKIRRCLERQGFGSIT